MCEVNTHIADSNLCSQLVQNVEHLLSDFLPGQSEGVVDIEEHDRPLGGAVGEGGVQLSHDGRLEEGNAEGNRR